MIKYDKKRGRAREAVFFTAVLFYILFVVLFIFLMKHLTREYVMDEIDKRLLMTARKIPYILPDDYHDRAVNSNSISLREYGVIEKKLTDITGITGMEYIWTDILIDGRVYLTTCNRTEQTDQQGLKIYYFMPYEDGVSGEEMAAFAGEEPVFADFRYRWGHFRAVFVPLYSPGGRKYLACAEFTLDYVETIVNKSAMISSLIALFFFLAFIPVFISYVWNARQRATVLKEKNEEIEKSEEHLRTTLNSIGDGVIVLDQEGIITTMNPVAENLTGWSLREAAGLNLSDVLNITDKATGERITNLFQKIIHEEHSGTFNNYLIMVSKNGNEKIISENGTPIINTEGRYIGSVIVLRDVTERERLEDELRQSQKLESIGQLAGGVAHDFNNMLAAIMGSAELLALHIKEDKMLSQYSEIIIKASRKASELTHKLLAFSRKGKKKTEPFDMHICIKNALTMLRRSIDRKIDIVTSLDAKYSIVIGDNTLFENVILNIGINSRDSMKGAGTFTVATSNVEFDNDFCCGSPFEITPGKYIRISLKDSGCGIPEKIKDKIFEPFFTTKKTGKGTGLGLSVVYGTVKEHHGMLSLESREGEGTEIIIALPVSSEAEYNPEQVSEVDHKGAGTILIIDDEEIVRKTFEGMLKSMSYDVIKASNGAEGLKIFEENRDIISAVFLDVIMPVMDGKEAFSRLREMAPSIPVIITTGYTSASNIKKLLSTEFTDFLQKPFKKSELAKVMMKIEREAIKRK